MERDRIAGVTPRAVAPRVGRRAVVLGLGGLAVAGVMVACGGGSGSATPQAAGTASPAGNAPGGQGAPAAASTAASGATQNSPAATAPLPPTIPPAAAGGGIPGGQSVPTLPSAPTVAVPIPVTTSTPVALPAFSSRVVAADMADPGQWNTVVLESSGRTLANNAYAVRVNKWPDGRGLLSWGDWVPRNVTLTTQFAAEVEMQLTGDPLAAGGILFLFNAVAATERQQFLAFLIRADGRFRLMQQLPGGEGFGVPRIDWVPTSAINTSTSATNAIRVMTRNGSLICGVNGRQVAQLPVPPDLAGYRGFALAADVPMESASSAVTAIFRNLRYEPFP